MDILDRRIWERDWLDLWTVVHITTGMCFGFSVFFYHSPAVESFIVFVFFSIVWEIVEYYHQAKEPLSNQFTDVSSGALGFLATVKFIPILAPTLRLEILYFTGVYIIAWSFAGVGFRSFATHFHPKMLEKYKRSVSASIILYIVILAAIMI